jgi:structural maintenance of chromosomes protein 5
MARGVASTESDGSQKENTDSFAPRIKTEKINNKGKGRAPQRIESDDEEDEVLQQTQLGVSDVEEDAEGENNSDLEGQSSPKGRKRARANTQGDARPLVANGSINGKAKKDPTTLPRDTDGYVKITHNTSFLMY